jgi:hypothetical protein
MGYPSVFIVPSHVDKGVVQLLKLISCQKIIFFSFIFTSFKHLSLLCRLKACLPSFATHCLFTTACYVQSLYHPQATRQPLYITIHGKTSGSHRSRFMFRIPSAKSYMFSHAEASITTGIASKFFFSFWWNKIPWLCALVSDTNVYFSYIGDLFFSARDWSFLVVPV